MNLAGRLDDMRATFKHIVKQKNLRESSTIEPQERVDTLEQLDLSLE